MAIRGSCLEWCPSGAPVLELMMCMNEMDMTGIRSQDCPMPTITKLFSDPTLADDVAAQVYRHSAGFLNFLAKTTRFDIAHSVSMLCTQMKQPTVGACKALRHLLGYLQLEGVHRFQDWWRLHATQYF